MDGNEQLGVIIVSAVVSGLFSALLAVVIMYLKGTHTKLETQRNALGDLEKNLPVDYVRREDFVRWTIKIDKKMDDIYRRMPKGD